MTAEVRTTVKHTNGAGAVIPISAGVYDSPDQPFTLHCNKSVYCWLCFADRLRGWSVFVVVDSFCIWTVDKTPLDSLVCEDLCEIASRRAVSPVQIMCFRRDV